MFKNWINRQERNRFLSKKIQSLIDEKIENFTSTEVTDSINNVCNYNYTRFEVNSELVEQGFYQNGFEWRLPAQSTTKVVDGIILLMMYAFIAFCIYLVAISFGLL
jgi:hypothetical protein